MFGFSSSPGFGSSTRSLIVLSFSSTTSPMRVNRPSKVRPPYTSLVMATRPPVTRPGRFFSRASSRAQTVERSDTVKRSLSGWHVLADDDVARDDAAVDGRTNRQGGIDEIGQVGSGSRRLLEERVELRVVPAERVQRRFGEAVLGRRRVELRLPPQDLLLLDGLVLEQFPRAIEFAARDGPSRAGLEEGRSAPAPAPGSAAPPPPGPRGPGRRDRRRPRSRGPRSAT